MLRTFILFALLAATTGCGKFFPDQSRALVSISVNPVTATIHPTATQQFSARGAFSDGSSVEITNQATWKSSDPNIVTSVTSSGLATGGASGTAIVSATKDGVVGVAAVTVAP